MGGYCVNGAETGVGLPPGGANGDTLGFANAAPDWLTPGRELVSLGVQRTYSFQTQQGWTTRDGGGDAKISSGFAACYLPPGAARPIDDTAPNITRALPQGGMGYRVVARLAAYDGATADTRAGIGASTSAVGDATGVTTWVGVVVRDDGVVQAYVDVGIGTPSASSAAGALPLDGTGWVCVECVAGRASVYYGTGTVTAEPLDWQRLYRGTRAVPHAADASIGLFAANYGVTVLPCSVTWSRVRMRAL